MIIVDDGTAKLTGTAVLSALVIVFDYTLKFSGLKIPFPWLPYLKFDFTGVPIVFALLLYGLDSGVSTSLVACLAILARSGDLVGALMKALAEVSTILGLYAGISLFSSCKKLYSAVLGLISRIVSMSLCNLVILPTYYGLPFQTAVNLLPLLGIFNAIQGVITTGLGFFIYNAYRRRMIGADSYPNK